MANHLRLLLLALLTIFNNLHLVSPAPKTPPPTTHSPPPPLTTTFKPPPRTTRPPPPSSSHTSSPPPSRSFSPPPLKSFPPPPSNKAFSPPPPSAIDEETTLEKIIDAITNQTEFGIWANLLSSSTTTTAATATLFIPSNAAFSHLPTPAAAAINFDPFLIPYHISPTRLSFHDLLHHYKPNSRIPTLLSSKSILITNTSALNFTIDNSRITRPDIYISPAFAVHGIQHILDYTLFGDHDFPATTSPPPLIPPLDELVGAATSDCFAAVEFHLFFSFISTAFALINILLIS